MAAPVLLVANPGWPAQWWAYPGAAVIKVFQPSPIYHTGVVIDGVMYQATLSRGVHAVSAECVTRDWIVVECPWRKPQNALEVYRAAEGSQYDLMGLPDWAVRKLAHNLFDLEIRPGIEDPKRWFCSELNAEMLGLEQPVKYGPDRLVEKVRMMA